MPALFMLELVTPAGALPPREVAFLDVPAEGGRLTVLAHHQPMVCMLRAGTVVARDGQGAEERWAIQSGTLAVERGGVTLLTRRLRSIPRAN